MKKVLVALCIIFATGFVALFISSISSNVRHKKELEEVRAQAYEEGYQNGRVDVNRETADSISTIREELKSDYQEQIIELNHNLYMAESDYDILNSRYKELESAYKELEVHSDKLFEKLKNTMYPDKKNLSYDEWAKLFE